MTGVAGVCLRKKIHVPDCKRQNLMSGVLPELAGKKLKSEWNLGGTKIGICASNPKERSSPFSGADSAPATNDPR